MIKGVNRQVVEVSDTGSEYFERILFIVKPEFSSTSESKLRARAQELSSAAGAPPRTRRKGKVIGTIAQITAAAGVGAAIGAVFLHF